MDKDSKLIILFSSFVFLIIGGWGISPIIQNAKNKNICVDAFTTRNLLQMKYQIKEGKKYELPISKKKWSRARAYRTCNHATFGDWGREN
tara:strand:+ start:39 stop:308 length:270 start_codon:yes stop_codon:yes gene_type:complete